MSGKPQTVEVEARYTYFKAYMDQLPIKFRVDNGPEKEYIIAQCETYERSSKIYYRLWIYEVA